MHDDPAFMVTESNGCEGGVMYNSQHDEWNPRIIHGSNCIDVPSGPRDPSSLRCTFVAVLDQLTTPMGEHKELMLPVIQGSMITPLSVR